MNAPLWLVTGFGPFLDVQENPSGLVARALESDPPDGLEVRCAILPVEFEAAGPALDRALDECPRPPVWLLSLGVHRGAWFRPEGLARARLRSTRPDGAGRFAADLPPLGPRDLRPRVDPARAAELLRTAGASDARPSNDAGGYVCERTYFANLTAAERLAIPGLFVHVPPISAVPVGEQVRVLRKALSLFATEWA